ncbi:LCP family protein [Geodermatophilus sp. SYSU D00684]
MTPAPDTDAGQGSPGRRRSRPRRRRWSRAALTALLLTLLALGTDAAVLAGRVDEVNVGLTADDADGRTWVLVGLDSRAALPEGADVRHFGTPDDVPGARADVVVVVHQTDAGTTAFSVPRDLVVASGRHLDRLALTWLGGPSATVAALCRLGVPADHLVTVDLAGFAAVVDAAGGLDVDVPAPVRDRPAGLLLERAGRQHVDGATALALVRSRHPEHRVDGVWVPAPVDPDGRATAAGAVLSALVAQVQRSLVLPWRVQSVAWAASGALAVDPGTSVPDLLALARADVGTVDVLPAADPVDGTLPRLPTAETTAAVATAGMSCDG